MQISPFKNLINFTQKQVGNTANFFLGSFTKRISADKEVEVIGGSDKYMATCRKCYFAKVNIPASPRIPLKAIESNGVENTDENLEAPAHKRALFDNQVIKETQEALI